MSWWYVVAVVFWILVVVPWFNLRMQQGNEGTRKVKKRTTTKKPEPTFPVPAPIGTWWQRKIIRWF